MRKIFVVAVGMILLFGCAEQNPPATPETKARTLIKEYINNNLGDPGSYEEIVLSPVDSIFDTPYYELARKQYEEAYDSLDMIYDAMLDLRLYNEASKVVDKQSELRNVWLDSLDTLSVEHSGYGVFHKFRAANLFGGKEIYMLYFGLNKELDSIISVDSVTLQDIYDLKEEVEQSKGRLDSLNSYERADLKRSENILNVALN